MRSHLRTVVVVVLALALLGLFLRNVDFSGVLRAIVHAQPGWLAALAGDDAVEPGDTRVALAVSARAARQGELRQLVSGDGGRIRGAAACCRRAPANSIRPYFLSRREPMSATGAFATIVIERLLDTITVLILLASYVFVFGRDLSDVNPIAFAAVKWAGAVAGAISLVALVVLFVMAGNPARLAAMFQRLEQVLPSAFAGLHRPHRREIRDRPRRDPAAGPGGRDAVLVVSACGCASPSGSGRSPGVPTRRAVHRLVSDHRAADDRHRDPDAGGRRRLSRGVPPRRDRVLRRARPGGGWRGDRAARDVGRVRRSSSACSSPRRKA